MPTLGVINKLNMFHFLKYGRLRPNLGSGDAVSRHKKMVQEDSC